MTREEKRKEKERIEKEFINSLKNKNITSEQKAKFRTTSFWKNFKKSFTDTVKIDPVSLRKLPKRSQLHHLDLNPRNYANLKKSNFVLVNGEVHEIIHYLYGIYRKDRDVLKRLKKILDKMVELNNGLDILDYKKLENQTIEKKRKKK